MLLNPYRFAAAGPSGLTITAGLQLWLDAADGGTVTESGGIVSQWDDKSAIGNDATQTVDAARRPALDVAAQNGHDAIDFGITGSSSEAAAEWMVLPSVTGKTFVLAFWPESGGGHVFTHDTAYPFHRGSALGSAAADVILDGTYSNAALRTGGATCRKSGTSIDPTAVGLNSGWQCVVFRTDGTALTINRLWSDRNLHNGGAVVGEVLVYDSVLSGSDVEEIEGYLAHKWDFDADLPGGHPYKSSPP